MDIFDWQKARGDLMVVMVTKILVLSIPTFGDF